MARKGYDEKPHTKYPCRMYDKKPQDHQDCYSCASRGGWNRCKRSRSPQLLQSAAAYFSRPCFSRA